MKQHEKNGNAALAKFKSAKTKAEKEDEKAAKKARKDAAKAKEKAVAQAEETEATMSEWAFMTELLDLKFVRHDGYITDPYGVRTIDIVAVVRDGKGANQLDILLNPSESGEPQTCTQHGGDGSAQVVPMHFATHVTWVKLGESVAEKRLTESGTVKDALDKAAGDEQGANRKLLTTTEFEPAMCFEHAEIQEMLEPLSYAN
eukprot:54339-Karenia_brevis.AAC.1